MANAKSSILLAFPPTDRPLPPFTVTTRDGDVLTSVEDVTEHLPQADRLSEPALERLLQDLAAEAADSTLQDPKCATSEGTALHERKARDFGTCSIIRPIRG